MVLIRFEDSLRSLMICSLDVPGVRVSDARMHALMHTLTPHYCSLVSHNLRTTFCPCRAAMKTANATQMDVAAVSVHGTGTPLGDPIEMGALGQGLKRAARNASSVLLLSNKACFGHTEGAAGLSGAMEFVVVKCIPILVCEHSGCSRR